MQCATSKIKWFEAGLAVLLATTFTLSASAEESRKTAEQFAQLYMKTF